MIYQDENCLTLRVMTAPAESSAFDFLAQAAVGPVFARSSSEYNLRWYYFEVLAGVLNISRRRSSL